LLRATVGTRFARLPSAAFFLRQISTAIRSSLAGAERWMAASADDPLREALAEGREEAFAELFDRFGPALFRVALVLLSTREDAEDAVQNLFVSLVRSRRSLATVENLRAYLFAGLRRSAARLGQRRKNLRVYSLDEVGPVSAKESHSLDWERAERLEKSLRNLPHEQRELVTLKV